MVALSLLLNPMGSIGRSWDRRDTGQVWVLPGEGISNGGGGTFPTLSAYPHPWDHFHPPLFGWKAMVLHGPPWSPPPGGPPELFSPTLIIRFYNSSLPLDQGLLGSRGGAGLTPPFLQFRS